MNSTAHDFYILRLPYVVSLCRRGPLNSTLRFLRVLCDSVVVTSFVLVSFRVFRGQVTSDG